MKRRRLLALSLFTLILIWASVFAPALASIWESGKIVYTSQAFGDLDVYSMGPDGNDKTVLTSSTAEFSRRETRFTDNNNVGEIKKEVNV